MTTANAAEVIARAKQLVREQLDAGKSLAEIARRVKYSRPAVSGFMAEKYKGNPVHLAGYIVALLGEGTIHCPHLDAPIALDTCRAWRQRRSPTSDTNALRHWTYCRSCPVGAGICPLGTRRPERKPARAASGRAA